MNINRILRKNVVERFKGRIC